MSLGLRHTVFRDHPLAARGTSVVVAAGQLPARARYWTLALLEEPESEEPGTVEAWNAA